MPNTDPVTDNGAEIVNEELWGMRKLAYPIQKKTTGFYTLIEFDGEATIVNKLETAYRRDEKVLRFLTFRLDKYAHEYAIKRRNLKKTAKQEEVKPEPVAQPEPEIAEPEFDEPEIEVNVEENNNQ